MLLDLGFDIPANIDDSVTMFTLWGMRVLSAVLILVAGWLLGNHIKDWISKIKKLDATLKFFLGGLAKYTIFIVAIITVLGQFGVQTASLIAVLGAIGLAVGLAMQGTLSNVAAGTMLLILRPFNVGDYIESANVAGTVKELGLFGTEMVTLDNIFVFVPNSQLWNSDIRNFSRNLQRRQDIIVSVTYEDDLNKALKVIKKILDGDERLILTPGKEPMVAVNGMGPMGVDILVRLWTVNADVLPVKWDITRAIKEALDESGITIPAAPRSMPAPEEKSRDKDKKAA